MKFLQPMKPQIFVTLGRQTGEQASPALVTAHLLGTVLCLLTLQKFHPAQYAQALPGEKFSELHLICLGVSLKIEHACI